MAWPDLTLLGMFGVNFLYDGAYSNLIPFLPFELDRHGGSPQILGWVFALFSVGSVVSPLISLLIEPVGRRTLLAICLFLYGLVLLSLGLGSLI